MRINSLFMQTINLLNKKTLTSILFVLSLFISISTNAQEENVNISGTITSDEDGSSLPGVNVLIKGTSTGTITDVEGKYQISCAKGDVLVFSFIGYISEEVTVGSESVVDFSLIPDIASLSEVVVIGYGTQKKSHLTGSVAKVKNEQLDQIPVSRVDEALVGKMAGVQIANVNAGPGEDPIIKVRGSSSLTSNSNPLLVIDGVQVDGSMLGSIDMNDVESIEVLKDAASAAIYGSQAADGVIMISTKKGVAGKTNFSFNAYKGVKSSVFTHWNRETADEWKGGDYFQKPYIDSLGTSTNWFEEMVPGGNIESYSLSAAGGNDKVVYNISGSYLNDDGILLTDNFKKYNARANVNIKPNDKWEIGLSIAPSATRKREFASDMNKALRGQPWLPIYHTAQSISHIPDEDFREGTVVGSYARESDYLHWPDSIAADGSNLRLRTSGDANPMQYVKERNYTTQTLNLITSGFISVKLYDGLKLKTQLSSTFSSGEENQRIGVLGDKSASKAKTSMEYTRDASWLSETYLTYDKSFGDHEINALLGISAQRLTSNVGEFDADGYENDYIRTISSANTMAKWQTTEEAIARNAVFGRLSYAYASKYLLSGSLRRDGSSTFGKDNRYGVFPSVSAGWRIMQESFMDNISTISELKLRASYGSNGKDATTSPYSHLDLYEPSAAVFNGDATSTSYVPSAIGNPLLKWQESSELTAGIDLGLLANRIFLSVEVYEKSTVDMLLDKDVSAVTGFQSAIVNQGEIKNTGVDFELRTNNISGSKFKWSSSVVLSTYSSEIVDLAGADSLVFRTEGKRGTEHIAYIGGEPSAFWGVEMAGEIGSDEYQYSEYPIGNTSQMVNGVDQDGDGEITDADKVVLGSPNPSLTWSFTNTLTYQNFDLSFTFLGKHGASVINVDPDYYEYGWFGAPTSDADDALYTKRNLSSYMVQDVSYIALRDLNFGYTLPLNLTEKVGIEKLRIYVAATNLGFWMMNDEYTGYNPDGNTGKDDSDKNPLMQGYQNGARPIAKTISIGVNLNF